MMQERLWTALVNIKPFEGLLFNDIIDNKGTIPKYNYIGAWANVLAKGETIIDAYNHIIGGVQEKKLLVVDFEFLDDYEHYKESFNVDGY